MGDSDNRQSVEILTDAMPLLPLAYEWEVESKGDAFGLVTDPQYLMIDIMRKMNSPDSVVLGLVVEGRAGGFTTLSKFQSPLGPQMIAEEHYWFVGKDYRGIGSLRLLKAAEKWAADQGCSHLLLSASMLASGLHDRVCKLYEKRGGRKFETTYIIKINE